MPIATGNKSRRKFFAMRFAAQRLLTLILFVSCAAALRAQSVQIMLVNGKTGRPLTDRPLLNVWVGHVREFPFEIPTDKHGVAPLHLTHNDSEINVPDCKGMQEESEKLQMNRNKKDEDEFNKKYKYCTAFEVNNPIVRFADSISIGPVIRTLNGAAYFRYVPCWADSGIAFSTEEVLQHGIVTANNCGKATASPEPGQLILFVRLPTQMEAGRQAWN
jgi:hypothetical protein